VSAEPLYDESGEHIGWMGENEDGLIVVENLDEEVVSYQDPADGRWVNIAQDYETDLYSELDERLERIEQLASEPRPPSEVMITRGLEQADADRVTEDLTRQGEYLEALIDRPLLISERRAIAQQVQNDIEGGDLRPDVINAAEKTGGLLNLDGGTRGQNHEARVEFMAQRLRDQERQADHAQGLDDVTYEEPPASREDYDLDDRNQRAAYYNDRMRGAVGPDAAYSSSDIDPEQLS
jgi:hypothetical protein